MNGKNPKLRRFSYLAIACLMFAAFIAYGIIPTHAYTNATLVKCNGAVVNTFTLGCTTAAETTLGIVVVMCGGSSDATIQAVTDTSNNQWGFAGSVNSIAAIPSSAGFASSPHLNILIWWSALKASTPTGDSITVTLQALNDGCNFETYVSDTAAYLFQTITSNADADLYQSPSTSVTNHVLGVSPIFNPVGTMVLAVGLMYDSGVAGTHSVTITSQLTTTESNAQTAIVAFASPINTDTLWDSTGSRFYPIGQNPNSYTVSFSSTTNAIRTYAWLLAAFSVSGLAPPNCADCTTTDGGNLLATTTQALTSNQTYFYVASTINGQLNFQNITTRLSSVSLTNSQNSATLELALYEIGTQAGGTASANRNLVTSGNPLNRIAFKDFTVTNTGTAKTYSFNPMITVWNNTQYAITLSVGHNGMNVFQTSTTGLTLNLDSADGFAPAAINTFASTTPQIYLTSTAFLQTKQAFINAINVISISLIQTTSTVQINAPDPTNAGNWTVQLIFLFAIAGLFMGIGIIADVDGPMMLVLTSLGVSIGMTMGTFGKLIPFPFTLVMWIAFGFTLFATQRGENPS